MGHFLQAMDAADRSQAAEELMRSIGIRRVLDQARSGRPAASGPRDCGRCGRPIPAARLDAVPGAELCTGCQAALEGAP